jgi:hypothetical protein
MVKQAIQSFVVLAVGKAGGFVKNGVPAQYHRLVALEALFVTVSQCSMLFLAITG